MQGWIWQRKVCGLYFQIAKLLEDVIHDFESQHFEIGPHKAYQLAKQIAEYNISLVSSMPPGDVANLKVRYESDLKTAIGHALENLPEDAKIAVLPYATHTMPQIIE